MTPNYPSFAEFAAAAPTVIDKVRGKDVDWATCVQATWIVAGFAASKVPFGDTLNLPVWGATSESDLAAGLEAAIVSQDSPGETKAVPWAVLLPLAIELFKLLLNRKK